MVRGGRDGLFATHAGGGRECAHPGASRTSSVHPRCSAPPSLRSLANVEDMFTACLPDLLRSTYASATSRSPGRSGAIAVVVSGCLADVFGTIGVAATSRSPGRSGAIEVVVSGCLADVLVPSAWLRRLVHLTGPVPSRLCSPVALPTSSVPSMQLRRVLHFACPGAVKNCSRATFGNALGITFRSPYRTPSRTPCRSPPRSPPRSSSRLYLRCFAKHQMRHTRLYSRCIFASIVKPGTGRRRRTAR